MKGRDREVIGSNCTSVKNANQTLIVDELRRNGQMSRTELAKKLQLSNPSISKNVEDLAERGIITEIGSAITDVGRRPIMLNFNKNCGCVGTVNFSHSDGVRVCLANMDGEPFEIVRFETNMPINKSMIDWSIEALHTLLRKFNSQRGELRCICIACPGIVNPHDGSLVFALRFEGYETLDFKGIFSDEFNVPILVKNDMNLAAYGEHSHGVGKGFSNLMYINIGLGIGSGLILNDQFFEGTYGFAGELGVVETPPSQDFNFDISTDDAFNLLNHDISLFAIINQISKRFDAGEPTYLRQLVNKSEDIEVGYIIEAVKNNDALCCEVAKKSARTFARLLVHANQILDLGLFIIGGIVAQFGDIYLNEIRKLFSQTLFYSNVRIVSSELKELAATYGAIDLATKTAISMLVEQCS